MSTIYIRPCVNGKFVRRAIRRTVTPLLCLLDYPDIEAGYIAYNHRAVEVYRDVSYPDTWTAILEEITRYARMRTTRRLEAKP